MKRHKIIGLLLLGAFIFTMGFNAPAFALDKLNTTKLFNELDGKPSSWYKKLPASQRFKLVLDGEAVLDLETGLVWERSPNTDTMDWYAAIYHCYNNVVGGRRGWRLPTIEELESLIDSTQGPPTLPAGHPFLNVQSSVYWSATTLAGIASNAWRVSFGGGDLDGNGEEKSFTSYVWCVRGGQGYDGGHNHD
ncbi:MAG TPA: Lcl domain-containing protein [Candidatus Brocadiia bacterium]|nr:DUF1566 domain-containing protein [Planctomycetota bacterium]MBI4006914.1 DUF1566 domain-containing protein [Planctomycetota bacterium]MDO8093599.1 DUF1566 domain-containing protein [Candidatus Brocadiales bacterium]